MNAKPNEDETNEIIDGGDDENVGEEIPVEN